MFKKFNVSIYNTFAWHYILYIMEKADLSCYIWNNDNLSCQISNENDSCLERLISTASYMQRMLPLYKQKYKNCIKMIP